MSLSHAFRNPKWSAFVEHQGIQSDRYSDLLLRSGVAHLISEDLQVDVNLGTSLKDTPSRIFIVMGASYRFDFHTDPKIKPIDEQKAGENGGEIKKNAMKKKEGKEKKKTKKGFGAEDIDLGPSKKQLRQKKKSDKKKKKDEGVIDF